MCRDKTDNSTGLQPGMIVRSKAGHDKLRLYLVMQVMHDRVWLTDGAARPVDKPKMKNLRHVKAIDTSVYRDMLQLLQNDGDAGQKNAVIRHLLEHCAGHRPANTPKSPVSKKEES
ncbi:MAG: KOW domain-containing RNA-binding protein [Bacillota bacterium]|nr:KOW domain-containing RNA-binding protein [Bacillota bacterium]